MIVRGNLRIPESDIKSSIETHRRSVYDLHKLDSDVRALYETGHLMDVKVLAEDGLHGGRIVTFEVKERPLIFDIKFEGIDSSLESEITDELNRQGVDLSVGSEYNPVNIRRAAKVIEELLSSKETRPVKVIPWEASTGRDVRITFRVD